MFCYSSTTDLVAGAYLNSEEWLSRVASLFNSSSITVFTCSGATKSWNKYVHLYIYEGLIRWTSQCVSTTWHSKISHTKYHTQNFLIPPKQQKEQENHASPYSLTWEHCRVSKPMVELRTNVMKSLQKLATGVFLQNQMCKCV